MASETIKALLMIALFGVLEVALYAPRMYNSHALKRVRHAMALHRPHWPIRAATSYALVPARVRRDPRRR